MRDFGKVPCSIWQKPEFEDLSTEAKLTYLYILSYPMANICGIFTTPTKYVKIDLNFSGDDLLRVSKELNESGLVSWNIKTKWVAVMDWLTINDPESKYNFKLKKGVRSALDSIPEVTGIEEAVEKIKEYFTNTYYFD